MENKRKDKNKINKKEILSRIHIIGEILDRFKIVDLPKEYEEDNISLFEKNKEYEIEDINDCFKDLRKNEIAYILYLFSISEERKNINMIINFFDTMNTILSHFEYYKIKNPNIKYNNSHFDNYLLKRYECSYIFTTYLSETDCRELKIDNKLYFNYIPIKCKEKHNNPEEKEYCSFGHNEIELKFHPFVYKKFKCKIPNCKKDSYCNLHHLDNDGQPIDMEIEVDFDSNEINNLQNVLKSLFYQKENDNNKESQKNSLNKQKQKKDFIPTEFNPLTYKRYKCPLGSICKLDNKLCLNYHHEKDRRRNPDSYHAILCPNLYKNNKRIKDGNCDLGDDCDKAHNLFEYFYHPDKFRKSKCKQEDPKNGKYCRERLICPYSHESDSDCGENGEKMKLDPDLISDYYRSLMVNYEKSIDYEMDKLNIIKRRYVCYKCGYANALDKESFLIDVKEKKIICNSCSEENHIETIELTWPNK